MPRTILITVLIQLLAVSQSHAADVVPPFVAGFDRFGRHDAIDRVNAGWLLATELSCTACHSAETSEQPKRGPVLAGVADRVQSPWLREFLAAPSVTKPGTTMPDVLAGMPENEKNESVSALVAFLQTLHKPFPVIKATGANPVPLEFWNRGNVSRGTELYHQMGCVACHAADENYEVAKIAPSPIDKLLNQLNDEEIAEMGLEAAARRVGSVPHADLSAKYTRQGLTHFLLNPATVRPSGRMPTFGLGAVDAADIAAYLMRTDTKPVEGSTKSAEPTLVEKGRVLFSKLGCANCHTVSGISAQSSARPFERLNPAAQQSCVGKPVANMPHFPIDEAQRTALDAAISHDVPSNRLQARMLQLNCYACHDRDRIGGVGRFRKPYFETVRNVDIGDEGRLPPSLTSVGSKLTKSWLGAVLAGKGNVRPHMHIRMPLFPKGQTQDLPTLLTTADQSAKPATEAEVFGSLKDLAADGRALMDVGCVQCHAFHGEALPGTIGVDMAGITRRLNPQWFRDFLRNPASLKSGTRMPTFFPGGRSQNNEILEGQMDRQIAAMWAYLKDSRQPLPQKILAARNQDYELKPTDKPIVLRTFMREAGTHAIAVGFPQQVHFAFDSEHVRLAEAWRGRFLDAEGTWFVRFTPVADPLGDQSAVFPASVPFAFLTKNKQPWPRDAGTAGYRFRGYRLDKQGVPTFLYSARNLEIEDRIEATEDRTLIRRFRIRQHDKEQDHDGWWYFRGHQGKTLRLTGDLKYTSDSDLTVHVTKGITSVGETRHDGSMAEWIVPFLVDGVLQIEVHYTW